MDVLSTLFLHIFPCSFLTLLMCQSLAGFVSLCLTAKDGPQAVIGGREATTLGAEF